ncbi:MAG: hypothetical protein ACPG8W_09105 [Candidatus Promineifilaceae bacterium]
MSQKTIKSYSSFQPKSFIGTATRDIKKVPFVELFNGRLQGVVSSGSDIRRVYVNFFEVETLNYYCSTNNNRPCGGLRGSPCKHLQAMLKQASAQYGLAQVANYLRVSADLGQIKTEHDILARRGSLVREPASEVFSRFLNYLRYLELEGSPQPNPSMAWFI